MATHFQSFHWCLVVPCAVLLGVLGRAAPVHAQDDTGGTSFLIAVDGDYAGAVSGWDLGSGGGVTLRMGPQLDLALIKLVIEGAGSYTHFSPDADLVRGLVGARIRVLDGIEPGAFAHAGVGHIWDSENHTGPAFDVGLSLDLTAIPVVNLGVQGAYNVLAGTGDAEALHWLSVGAHVTLVF